jgi:hypothetical protein
MWYLGHFLSGISILFTHDYFYIAVSFVFFGQFITILSRPIGRIQKREPLLDIKKTYIEEELNYEI